MKNRTKTNVTLPHIPLLHNASARSVWFCTKRCDPSMSKNKFRRPVWKKTRVCAIKTGELKWSFLEHSEASGKSDFGLGLLISPGKMGIR